MIVDHKLDEITICVTTHGKINYSKACIYSLIHNTIHPFKLILCSDVNDGTKEWADQIPEIHYCEYSPTPYKGAAQARNANIKIANEIGNEFCVLSDNDNMVPKAWDRHIFDIMEEQPDIGLAMPMVLDMTWLSIPKLSDKISFIKQRKNDNNHFHTMKNIIDEAYQEYGGFDTYADKMIADNLDVPLQSFSNTWSFYAFRLSAMHAVGGYDEEFIGAAWEDIDLARRLNKTGYRTVICCQSLIHHWMNTTRSTEPDAVAKETQNKEYYRQKWT